MIGSTAWAALLLVSGAATASEPAWHLQDLSDQPTARSGNAAAYSESQDLVLMFGGLHAGDFVGDTWTWDGDGWTEHFDTPAPPGRSWPAMAYDQQSDQVVVFGGIGDDGSGPFDRVDTWGWDGGWLQLDRGTDLHPTGPTAGAMATNPGGGVILFGGFQSQFDANGQLSGATIYPETWRYQFPQGWSQVLVSGPSERAQAAMTYDSARDVCVLFGGHQGSHALGDTWEWDGGAWQQRTPKTSPPARLSASLTFDADRKVAVLFGGAGMPATHFDDTWQWDGNDWRQVSADSRPDPRSDISLVFHPGVGKAVVFGGWDGTANLDDTWELYAQRSHYAANCANRQHPEPLAGLLVLMIMIRRQRAPTRRKLQGQPYPKSYGQSRTPPHVGVVHEKLVTQVETNSKRPYA